ncbi:DNA integrity scanning protein DisA [Sediminibacillus dalangtanensis]|uniref:DNA integrity scanning protein DisA n=1 Tax=Sediminibacillus dalangtanensis TaxID=2729421 RepID=A0ABX7VWE9_9BACI|nr:DNA integrity scanning diadenylate cyclase DisA [Sediminibacillus dalangtanensis]QTN01298.1 DNA integrity scanning protein DisA [Sediminibacillus dalangtanensis]
MEWQGRKEAKVLEAMLKFVAPGTPMRQGIDNVLRANTGGLIVVGSPDKLKGVVDGGFAINASFSPANLYELAKMDGAILLSEDASTILYANVQLMPEPTIPSKETGMRHRTAERVAKQTETLVIAISERRNVITLYNGGIRYALKEMGVILTKANQAMQTLEKYKIVLDQTLTNLGALEFEDLVTLTEIVQVFHRIEMVLRIKTEILKYITELGTEGRLIQLQLTELVADIEVEAALIIRDYSTDSGLSPEEMLLKMQEVVSAELTSEEHIIKMLGYSLDFKRDAIIYPRGYRVLAKIPRLPHVIIDYLIDHFGMLNEVANASTQELVSVNGVGDIRAKKIKDGLNRLQEQLFIDRTI